MINEQCWIIVGGSDNYMWWGNLIEMTEGTPSDVGFDYRKVMEMEEKEGNIVGFYHTHPSFPATPSPRDEDTMLAWSCALGKPLVCAIQGVDALRAYEYDDKYNIDTSRLPSVVRIGDFIFGVWADCSEDLEDLDEEDDNGNEQI